LKNKRIETEKMEKVQKRNETKRNETKRNETKRNETKRNCYQEIKARVRLLSTTGKVYTLRKGNIGPIRRSKKLIRSKGRKSTKRPRATAAQKFLS
jgi:hypothetical protein